MNITLIRPPAYSTGLMGAQLVPFLGIAYIGAVAKKAGHNVDIIDMCGEDIARTEIIQDRYVAYGMSFASLDKRLKTSEVIGFTCMFSQDWVFHKALIEYVHRLSPDSVFIAGGEHISALPEYCLDDCPELDICVVGEGEDVFTHLISTLEEKGRLSNVPSLVYRDCKNGVYHSTKRSNRIKDIDRIPLPIWDLTPMENYLSRELNYHIQRGRTIPMVATRGCPYNCTFCSSFNMWGRLWIPRNPRLVVDEMEYYIDKYKADNFVFSELTTIVRRKEIVDLCNEIINRRINVTWQLPTLRTEDVDYDILKLMYQAGCRDLDFAIESGSRKVLLSVNKSNNPNKIFSLAGDAVDLGMNLSTNIVVGLPQERFRDFFKTYWLVVKLAIRGSQELNVFPFVPYPGSELFKDFLRDKRISLNDDYFLNLFGYGNLSKAISWSEHFGPRTLNFMRLFLLVNFYGLMLIAHPRRILQLISNTVRGRATTKLENVLKKVFKNVNVYVSSRAGNTE